MFKSLKNPSKELIFFYLTITILISSFITVIVMIVIYSNNETKDASRVINYWFTLLAICTSMLSLAIIFYIQNELKKREKSEEIKKMKKNDFIEILNSNPNWVDDYYKKTGKKKSISKSARSQFGKSSNEKSETKEVK